MEFIKLGGKTWCLCDKFWNGEYFEAWEVDSYHHSLDGGEVRNIKPIYKEVDTDEFELVGYEFV